MLVLLLVLALVLRVPQVANGAAAAHCAGSGRPQVLVRKPRIRETLEHDKNTSIILSINRGGGGSQQKLKS